MLPALSDTAMTTRKVHWTLATLGALAIALADAADAQEGARREEEARALVEAVLGETATERQREMHEELAAWAETVIGNAPEGPADANAEWSDDTDAMSSGANLSETLGMAWSVPPGRSEDSEVIVFMSLAVPEPSWREWSAEAARVGAPMMLRGVRPEGLAATVRAILERQSGDGAGIGIDPRLFRLFRIGHVPAVAVVPGGVPPCESPGCSADPPPAHDLVTGNIGLEAALEAIAREGDTGRQAARRQLDALRGELN